MKNLILILALFALTACGQKKSADSELDISAVTIESATSLISGVADDQSGDNYASYIPRPDGLNFIINQAWAASCVRAVYSSCNSGIRSQTYNDCDLGSSTLKMSGQVQLNYSSTVCSMGSVGNSVTRSYDVTLSGIRGGELSISSQNQSDYKGQTYGGGGRLTTQAAGWSLDIFGKHKTLSVNGVELARVSIRTLQSVNITGSLSRVSRLVSGGQLEVNYNRIQATALLVPQNLQWSNTCCHPISGSLQVTWSGSKVGSSSVTFNGCGQASLNENGQVRDIELSYCE